MVCRIEFSHLKRKSIFSPRWPQLGPGLIVGTSHRNARMNRRWVQEWCQQMDKLQKLKKSFIYRFGWKDFPSYYKYIHLRAIFVLEKGGVLLLGTVLLLGHIRYTYFFGSNLLNESHPSNPQDLEG